MLESKSRAESGMRLGFKAGAIIAFGLFVLASNTVGPQAAALPPILLVIAVSLVICLL